MNVRFFLQLLLFVAASGLSSYGSYVYAEEAAGTVNIDYEFVINLMSSGEPFADDSIIYHEAFDEYRFYATRVKVEDNTWNRLRLGFFEAKRDAVEVMEQVRAKYPGAWVAIASEAERLNSAANAIALNGAAKMDVRREALAVSNTAPAVVSSNGGVSPFG